MYVNGVVDCSLFTSTTNNGGPVNSVGRNWYTTFDGKISTISIYTISLTNTQILQNYYAGLQRFIPTSTTTLWLDGENTNTRVITPTIAYDTGIDLNNGTLMNSMVLSHRDGGTSFLFDGVDDYINCGSPYYLTTSVANLTISIWFKLTSTPVGSNTIIKFGANNSGWLIGVSSGGIYFQLYTNSNSFTGGGYSVPLNVWNNVTFTFNGPTYTLYVNGSSVSTTSTSGSIINGGNTTVNIGRDGSISSNYFAGKMSIIRTFAQTLTASEVLNIYNAGKQRHGL